MSVSAIESEQIFAGIRPYVQPRQNYFPLGPFWHNCCFLFGAGAEDGEGACVEHPRHPPLPLPQSLCWGWWWWQLTFQTRHTLPGFII